VYVVVEARYVLAVPRRDVAARRWFAVRFNDRTRTFRNQKSGVASARAELRIATWCIRRRERGAFWAEIERDVGVSAARTPSSPGDERGPGRRLLRG